MKRYDACLALIRSEETWYHCSWCMSGDFDICDWCYNVGSRCLHGDHVLHIDGQPSGNDHPLRNVPNG